MRGVRGIKTKIVAGISELDKVKHWFKRGELIVIAGRPGMGQVDLLCAVINKVALETAGKKSSVLYFTIGDPMALEFRLRLDCMSAKVDVSKVIQWRLTQSELGRLREAREKVSGSLVRIIPVGSQTKVSFLRTMVEDQSESGQHRLVALESLSLGGCYKGYKGITNVCKYLKTVALRYNVAVVALCELPVSVERRKNHVPRLDDLREIGQIEKYADKIIFVYRDSYYQGAKGGKP